VETAEVLLDLLCLWQAKKPFLKDPSHVRDLWLFGALGSHCSQRTGTLESWGSKARSTGEADPPLVW